MRLTNASPQSASGFETTETGDVVKMDCFAKGVAMTAVARIAAGQLLRGLFLVIFMDK
jgi:hypothetical protein